MTIKAEAHSDDYAVEVAFDATEFFDQATPEELLDLAHCGWGGDVPADRVAEDLAERGVELSASRHTLAMLLAHIPGPHEDTSGFECHIDADDATTWLLRHRPAIAARLDEARAATPDEQ